jgi:hypothetical protein
MDPQLGKAVEEGRSCFTDRNCSASALALKQIMETLGTPQQEDSVTPVPCAPLYITTTC